LSARPRSVLWLSRSPRCRRCLPLHHLVEVSAGVVIGVVSVDYRSLECALVELSVLNWLVAVDLEEVGERI